MGYTPATPLSANNNTIENGANILPRPVLFGALFCEAVHLLRELCVDANLQASNQSLQDGTSHCISTSREGRGAPPPLPPLEALATTAAEVCS